MHFLTNIWHGRMGGLRLTMLVATALLLIIGLICIQAAGNTTILKKQMLWIAVGSAAFIFVNLFHYKLLGEYCFFLYLFVIALLIFILIGKYLGFNRAVPIISGSARWIKLLPFESDNALVTAARVQPSELAKLVYIISLAWYLNHHRNYRNWRGLIAPFLITFVPMALILIEPDLGTTLLFPPVMFAMLFVAGARLRHLLLVIFIAGLVAIPAYKFALRPYQKDRILCLINQNSDNPFWIKGPGYQLYHSKICIGSGGLTGQGWQQGIYVDYTFLPERHNDFIFALIAHQWGFVGSVIVLLLYTVLLIAGIEIAIQQVDPFGQLVAVGICALFAVQTFINIGMNIGLMPITGLTLPFISYGGSSLLTNFLALGILFNIARHYPRQIAKRPFEFDD